MYFINKIMKAKLKNGETLSVAFNPDLNKWVEVADSDVVRVFNACDIEEFIPESGQSEPDWEQRRWDAALAAMQGVLANSAYAKNLAIEECIEIADALIEEFKKQKP
jgi:hypothetical protein